MAEVPTYTPADPLTGLEVFHAVQNSVSVKITPEQMRVYGIGSQGPQGLRGFQGLKGFQGFQGVQGSLGVKGDQGYQGTQGDDSTVPGPQGPQGTQGLTGDQGVTGDQGSQGEDSTVQGPQGTQGTQGVAGDQGADSTVQGPQGYQGIQGTQGVAGDQGADSTVQGPQGTQGDQGDQGADSVVPGPQGTTGTQGTQGYQGDAGADSVVPGSQGDQGDQGTTGVQGDQGDQGADGADSVVPGPQGTQGTQGTQGDTGADAVVYTTVIANYTIQYPKECVLVDSTVGPITIILPASPSVGDYAGVWDDGHNAYTNPITILRNGNALGGRVENAEIDRSSGRFDFTKAATTWEFGIVRGCAEAASSSFILQYDTTGFPNTVVGLPLVATTLDDSYNTQYYFTIDWGDGSPTEIVAAYDDPASHTYVTGGVYDLTMTGLIEGFSYNSDYAEQIDGWEYLVDILNWGDVGVVEWNESFYGMLLLRISAKDGPSLNNLYEYGDIEYMFQNNSDLLTADFTGWKTHAIESFYGFLDNCPLVVTTGIGNLNVGNCTDFRYMIYDTSSNENLSNWDLHSAEYMSNLIGVTSAFTVANYDIFLSSIAQQSGSLNSTVSLGVAQNYTTATSQSAKDLITGSPNNWVITDNGGI